MVVVVAAAAAAVWKVWGGKARAAGVQGVCVWGGGGQCGRCGEERSG